MVLRNEHLQAEVLPGKGGDVLSLRCVPRDLELLWQAPWGLRPHGAVPTAGPSEATLIENYPGGWQTVFPNGGTASQEQGIEWGMHGEAWLAPWQWQPVESGVELTTRLVRSPFELVKTFVLDGPRLVMTERVRNGGGHPVEVMWSHHPAFGGPLVAEGCRIEVPDGVMVVVDDERLTPHGDLVPGVSAPWPHLPARTGGIVDVSVVPSHHERADRLGYLTGFPRGHAALVNANLGLAVDLDWDADVFPSAWLWVEAHATPGFPWFQAVHVVAVEPATSWPAQGLAAVRRKTMNQVALAAGESRTATVSVGTRLLGT